MGFIDPESAQDVAASSISIFALFCFINGLLTDELLQRHSTTLKRHIYGYTFMDTRMAFFLEISHDKSQMA